MKSFITLIIQFKVVFMKKFMFPFLVSKRETYENEIWIVLINAFWKLMNNADLKLYNHTIDLDARINVYRTKRNSL